MAKITAKYARVPLDAARHNSVGEMIEKGNTRGRRRMGTTSFEFAEDGVHKETLLESGGPESEATVIARYRRTGRHLGKFDTPRAADEYAKSAGKRARKRD
jgi:hypothetical protein